MTNIAGAAGRLKKPAARVCAAAAVVWAGYTLIEPGTQSVEAGGSSATPARTATPTRFPVPTASPTPFAPSSRTEVNVGAPSIVINNIYPTPAGPTADEIQREVERVVQGRLNAKATSTAMAQSKIEKTPTPPAPPVIVRVETRDNVFDWGDAFMGAMVLWFLGTAAVAGATVSAAYLNKARIAQFLQAHVKIKFK